MQALLKVAKLDANCIVLAGRVVLGLAGAETRTEASTAWMVMNVDGFASHASSAMRGAPWSIASLCGGMAVPAPREESRAGTVPSASFMVRNVMMQAGCVLIALGTESSMAAVGTRWM